MALYNLRSDPFNPPLFIITKFTSDLEVESSYSVGTTACECPAGHRPSCRHRQMLPTLRQRIDTAWFWNFEAQAWEDPTGAARAEAERPDELITEEELEEDGDLVDEDQVDEGLAKAELAPQAGGQVVLCEDEGCDHAAIPHVCVDSSTQSLLNAATPAAPEISTAPKAGFRRRI